MRNYFLLQAIRKSRVNQLTQLLPPKAAHFQRKLPHSDGNIFSIVSPSLLMLAYLIQKQRLLVSEHLPDRCESQTELCRSMWSSAASVSASIKPQLLMLLVEFLHFCDIRRCSCFSSKDIFGSMSWTT